MRDGVGFAAQNRAERAAHCGNARWPAARFSDGRPGFSDGRPVTCAMATPARTTAMQKISGRIQFCAEPKPFNQRGEGRGEALGEQHRSAAAEPRQGLKICRIAQADAEPARSRRRWKTRRRLCPRRNDSPRPPGKERRAQIRQKLASTPPSRVAVRCPQIADMANSSVVRSAANMLDTDGKNSTRRLSLRRGEPGTGDYSSS